MSKEIENPQAFPSTERGIDNRTGLPTISTSPGMTLRDYFAAKAMVSLIGNETLRMSLIFDSPKPVSPESVNAYFSKEAYGIADAMLKARQK